MATSKIEWTEQTWNPVAGCSAISPGCTHCYAAVMTKRLAAMGQEDYAGLIGERHFNGTLRPLPHKLDVPLRRRKPTMWFVNSMSDLFHVNVPVEFIADVFATMWAAQWHTFQVLTKRADHMASLLSNPRFPWAIGVRAYEQLKRRAPHQTEVLTVEDLQRDVMENWPLPNVWLGTSVENQEQADKRIPHLLQTPAAVRFLSCEPLLGAVDLYKVPRPDDAYFRWRGETGCIGPKDEPDDYVYWMKKGIGWVIVGGESGHGARPMHPDWARSLRDQCVAAGVPFFFKQWGEWLPYEEDAQPPFWKSQAGNFIDGNCLPELTEHEPVGGWYWPADQFADPLITVAIYNGAGKKAAGRLLDGRDWNEMPEVNRG